MSRTAIILLSAILAASIAGSYFFLSQKPDENTHVFERERMEAPAGNDVVKTAEAPPIEEEDALALAPFGTVSVVPDMMLDGTGTNIDSPEFWEAPNAEDTLLLVSAKGNDLVEVWKYPFVGTELPPLRLAPTPNGLDVDQDRDMLIVGDSQERIIRVHSLPDQAFVRTIGKGEIGSGETNIDILDREGKKWVFVSESHAVKAFDLDSGALLSSFEPQVESIEEILADSFSQTIYVPEEEGIASDVIRNGGIVAYTPSGSPLPSDDTPRLAAKSGTNAARFSARSLFRGKYHLLSQSETGTDEIPIGRDERRREPEQDGDARRYRHVRKPEKSVPEAVYEIEDRIDRREVPPESR